MKHTCQSETGKLKSLFIKKPEAAFRSNAHLEKDWAALNYLGKPDYETAKEEYRLFESNLLKKGVDIFYLPEDDGVTMDSIYCRDASIFTDQGIIVCNMGKPARSGEPQASRRAFEAHGLTILGEIKFPGTVEGGDVAWLDEHTLAIGHTYRTNAEGILQVRMLLEPFGITVIEVPLPHYKGPADVFHLMSILSPVDHNLAVVYSPLMPIGFRNLLLDRGYQLVEVPDEEFDAMGCNVLALSPRECLVVAGNPLTHAALEKAGCRVNKYSGMEISVKGGGGPTCLTRPYLREKQVNP